MNLRALSLSAPHQLTVLMALSIGLLLGGIWPLAQQNHSLKQAIHTTADELLGLRKLAGHIQVLETGLTADQKTKPQGSLLKQVEDISRAAGIFNDIQNITPIQLPHGKQGLTLTLENIPFTRLLPLFAELDKQTLMVLQQMDIRRLSGDDSHISARLTVAEVF